MVMNPQGVMVVMISLKMMGLTMVGVSEDPPDLLDPQDQDGVHLVVEDGDEEDFVADHLIALCVEAQGVDLDPHQV